MLDISVLDLFLWCPTLVLVLGILSFVGKVAVLLVGHPGVELTEGFFPFLPTFLGLMDHPLQVGSLK
jgi:hypothetical protein